MFQRQLLSIACLFSVVTAYAQESPIARMKADLFFLASPECEGRGLRTNGLNKAADHIAAAFKAAGLKSAVADGSYFQPFVVKETYLEAGPHELTLTGPFNNALAVEYKTQFTVCGMSGKGIVGGEIIFAGYGITAEKKYDDYAGLDVKNKIVVVLRQVPRMRAKDKPLFNDGEVPQYASLAYKVENAVKHGAAGVIFLNDTDKAGKDDPLMDYEYAKEDGKTASMPVLHVRRTFIDAMLRPLGTTLANREAAIDRTLQPHSHAIPGWSAKLQSSVGVRELKVKNVVGYLDGVGDLAQETIVFGAHYDHLGRGERGAKDPSNAGIHYGADDNASGTTGLLELARRYSAMKNRSGRRLVFIAFSGEERGLLGSQHYCANPLFPVKDTIAMFNMDMIGRVRPDEKTKNDRLLVGGVGSAKNFEKLLDDTNAKYKFQLEKSKSGTGPSDHTSFYMVKVPVFFLFSGDHPEYHTPKDLPETINLAGIKKVVDMVEEMANTVNATKDRPEYVPGMISSSGGMRSGPRMGLMPGYDETENRGMPVTGIIPGGAAELAGIRKGDLIIAIGGKPVKNVQDYMKAMAGCKAGEEIELSLERDGKPLKVKATPK